MNRRLFVRTGVSGLILGGGVLSRSLHASFPREPERQGSDPMYPGYPRQDPAKVLEVVTVSHNNLTRVKELVQAQPALAKASWDWGFGDWESPLGAASHTGRKEIALFLLQHGARPTIFSATMLGQLGVVKAFVEASPGVERVPGPHSITLLAHARAGGEDALEVLQFLESLGDADVRPLVTELSSEERERYVGSYAFGPGADDRFTVSERRGGLVIQHNTDATRGLFHLGNRTFQPVGAESVRIRFSSESPVALRLEVLDSDVIVPATRI